MCHIVQIGIGVHDTSRIAAQFENDFLLSSTSLQIPADGGRASEAKQLQAIVRCEQVGAVATARKDRERAFGEVGFREHLANDQRSDRRAAGWLQDKRATNGDRGSDFMGGKVQREVERRDERTRATE